MWAAGGVDRNFCLAEWTNFSGWRFFDRLFADGGNFVDSLEQQEEHKGHDEEIDNGTEEVGAKAGDILQGVGFCTGDKVEDWVDKVVCQGGDNGCERTPDDNTDGHVHHVAAERKRFKFFDKVFDLTHDNVPSLNNILIVNDQHLYYRTFSCLRDMCFSRNLLSYIIIHYKCQGSLREQEACAGRRRCLRCKRRGARRRRAAGL